MIPTWRASVTERNRRTPKFRTVNTFFGRILVEEGGGKAGRRAAANYALRCMALGGKCFLYDEWTQQLKLAYVVQGFRDTFEQEWVLEKVSAQT